MKVRRLSRLVLACAVLSALGAPAALASLTLTTGLGTSHTNNLVTNGSFEIGAPPNGLANANFWANTSLSPNVVPPGWTATGGGDTAHWGNDGPGTARLLFSDVLPDGRAAVDFKTTTGTIVSQPPTFNPDGSVTFPSPPTFGIVGGSPVVLKQTVNTQLTPQPLYNLSFWVSGEENSTNQGNIGTGLIGMRLTNVLSGDPIQWLAVPNSINYGMSKRYEFQFAPLNPLQPVGLSFIGVGGTNLTMYGGSAFGTQAILDDVIINAVPEPGSLALALLGAAALLAGRQLRRRRVHQPA